jgi:hypothetical protein
MFIGVAAPKSPHRFLFTFEAFAFIVTAGKALPKFPSGTAYRCRHIDDILESQKMYWKNWNDTDIMDIATLAAMVIPKPVVVDMAEKLYTNSNVAAYMTATSRCLTLGQTGGAPCPDGKMAMEFLTREKMVAQYAGVPIPTSSDWSQYVSFRERMTSAYTWYRERDKMTDYDEMWYIGHIIANLADKSLMRDFRRAVGMSKRFHELLAIGSQMDDEYFNTYINNAPKGDIDATASDSDYECSVSKKTKLNPTKEE